MRSGSIYRGKMHEISRRIQWKHSRDQKKHYTIKQMTFYYISYEFPINSYTGVGGMGAALLIMQETHTQTQEKWCVGTQAKPAQ